MYKCEIIADSLSPQGNRLTTFLVTYPRIIHAEMCRHRILSRNSASSRAIPFKRMVQMVEENPFIPIAWQKDHKGMQGSEYLTSEENLNACVNRWLAARDEVVFQTKGLHDIGLTKQLCNRLLESFMWHTEIITGTQWENFFELRCPKYELEERNDYGELVKIHKFKSKKDILKEGNWYSDEISKFTSDFTEMDWLQVNKSQADIHIQAIAELMWDAYNESIPEQLQPGQWHIPFGDNIDIIIQDDEVLATYRNQIPIQVKIATARCARISYKTLGDNPKIDYKADTKLHDRLLEQHHMSPFEHCARAMSEEEYDSFIKGKVRLGLDTFSGGWGGPPNTTYHPNENTQGWCNNFKGFIQYRYLIEN